ncbi:MAG: hypothetical protein ACYS8K_04535, partial [Planctomycetota bacterium]
MAEAGEGGQDVLWTFRADAPVRHVALASDGARAAVADAEGTIYVLDDSGAVTGRFQAEGTVCRLRAAPQGRLFCVGTVGGIVYGLGAAGVLQWRTELGGSIVDCDCDADAQRLAAVSAGGWLYLYSSASQERLVVPVGWPTEALAVAQAEPFRAAVCGEGGRVALVDENGAALWQQEMACGRCAISACREAGLIVVAAAEQGVILLDMAGERTRSLDAGAAALRAEGHSQGAPFAVETADGRLRLLSDESHVVWQQRLRGGSAP